MYHGPTHIRKTPESPTIALVTTHANHNTEGTGFSTVRYGVEEDEDMFDQTSPLVIERPSEEFWGPYKYSSTYSSRSNDRGKSPWLPTGWRLAMTIAAGLTSLILVGNATLLGVFTAQAQRGGSQNVSSVRTGDCGEIKKIGVILHVVINIISTILLSASNYCMQTVSAPTREDVDKAHSKGLTLHIGIPSVQNLLYIRPRRALIWLCLGLTSIPLHLVYNSIFFVSGGHNLYTLLLADESFASGASYNKTFFSHSHMYEAVDILAIQRELMEGGKYEKLTKNACIEGYAKNMIDNRGDLILVMENPPNCTLLQKTTNATCGVPHTSMSSLYAYYNSNDRFEPNAIQTSRYSWICPEDDQPCSDGRWRNQLGDGDWNVGGAKVKYCLSQKVQGMCQLRVATNLICVVVAFNAMKLILLILMASGRLVNDNPLVTLGDAAASFIESPDPTTKDMCLLSAHDIVHHRFSNGAASRYQPPRKRWASAVSRVRWTVTAFLTSTAIFTIFGLLGFSVKNLKDRYDRSDFQSLWSFGVGQVTPYTLIEFWELPSTGDGAVVNTVLLTNLPQLLISFFYMVFNATLTAMTSAAEWSRYAHGEPRPLRVSFPQGGQRCTFWLQLPYLYSLPILVLSMLMHWLISQSIYITQIFQKELWTGKEKVLTTASYSPVAITATMLLIILLFGFMVVLSRRRLSDGIPLVGAYSAVISAACHVPRETSSLMPVKWGVVKNTSWGIGHCSFSNESVGLPEQKRLYT